MQFNRSEEIVNWMTSLQEDLRDIDEKINEARYQQDVLTMRYQILMEIPNKLRGELLKQFSNRLGDVDSEIAILKQDKKEILAILDHLETK
ncbi:chromosome segregation ATPase [Bacillus niacini]|uniref:Chromosome segregation ATPase n=1 Tax=Neobacillus niacini TaxID=86668 RepID=A0A852TJL2_9BACI|nr:hypothetical protein [Neobacillus niacini]NYE07294.1 chromosome segregation ATPase [Neobacillus niacini]